METTLVKAAEADTEFKPGYAPGTFHACEAHKEPTFRSYYFAEVNGAILGYCKHHADMWEVELLAASQGRVWDRRHTIIPQT
jgi:hypothetical protein